jgi:hypothetical protein
VERGSYDVPAADVADSVVAFFRRDLPQAADGNPRFGENSC